MVYKRRYKTDDPTEEEIKERQARLAQSADSGAIAKNLMKSSLLPRSTATSLGEVQPDPELYDSEGKLNKRYDTSIGQDVLAGMGIGMQNVRSDNPFAQLGGALGGSIAGLFTKNVAGKQKHKADTQENRERNNQIIMRTQAQERAESMRMQREARQKQLEIAQAREKRMLDMANAKTNENKKKVLQNNISTAYQSGDTEEVKKYQQALAESMNYTGEIPEDYGVNWSDEPKKVGNFMFHVDKNNPNNRKMATDLQGNPISSLTISDWLKLKKEAVKAKFDENVESQSYNQAVDFVTRLEKEGDLKFRTANGKVNYASRNAYIIDVAEQISDSLYESKAPNTIYINGSPIKMDISSTPSAPPLANTSESPFMPSDIGEAPKMVDATKPPLAQDVLPKYEAPNFTNEQREVFNSFIDESKKLTPEKQADFNEAWEKVPEGGTMVTYKTIKGKRHKIILKKQNGSPVPADIQ